MSINEFKNKLHKILNEGILESSFNLEESAGEVKKEFIHTSPDGKTYKIEVEQSENEFYVFDENGKKLDIFQLDMLDIDGGVPKDLRSAIVNTYKSKFQNKEEVVTEIATPDRYSAKKGFTQVSNNKPVPKRNESEIETQKFEKKPQLVSEQVNIDFTKIKELPMDVAEKNDEFSDIVIEQLDIGNNKYLSLTNFTVYATVDPGQSESPARYSTKGSIGLSDPGEPGQSASVEFLKLAVSSDTIGAIGEGDNEIPLDFSQLDKSKLYDIDVLLTEWGAYNDVYAFLETKVLDSLSDDHGDY